ncbi:TniB family NTP-binding protein [Endozoicomonas sp. G2_1]|uniref:TniB family NTP-binding protein n=1 Tax=Endozoicomonas sp. G2_1 TaxID=2821091 RepID=UPI001ADD3580|nr:TniB family NTP-binding protein [Endozoicomonas sp. G2_1]MBO9490455.1 TniB family NTP-binding protein [Endozoicomonas sp. G2_1]
MKHLHKSVLHIADLPAKERIHETLKRRWIGYSNANNTLKRMEDILNHPKTHRMPNLLIKSHTNNGKSFLLERFLKSHQPYECPYEDKMVVPVIFIEIPPDASPDTIYTQILNVLHITYSYSSKKDVKAQLAFDAIELYKVKVLLIDELHVLMNTTKLKKAQMLDALKYIGNRCQISIIGAGTQEAHTAILSDNQLANRFEPIVLPRWQLSSEYRKLLATFEKIIPLRAPSNLQQQDIAMEIYTMSGGWIGEIDAILKRAAKYAIENGEEQITLKTLSKIDWIAPEVRRKV